MTPKEIAKTLVKEKKAYHYAVLVEGEQCLSIVFRKGSVLIYPDGHYEVYPYPVLEV